VKDTGQMFKSETERWCYMGFVFRLKEIDTGKKIQYIFTLLS